jgi:UDP-N-acetylglucosamine acyltransferase
LNLEGLKRRGFSREQIDAIKKAYRILFQSGMTAKAAVKKAKKEIPGSVEVERLATFVENSRRGICR